MNILLTNDDGVNFPGILALKKIFTDNGHQVFIMAPASEKSATSQAMTINDSIVVQLLENNIYSVQGFPVDCVNIALYSSIFKTFFDLVISGINKGVNMGHDVLYSGTVAAARHAFLRGISALAVSSGYDSENGDFDTAAQIVYTFVENFVISSNFFKKPFLLNMNIPDTIRSEYDIKWTKLGERIYRDLYKEKVTEDGSFLLRLEGELLNKGKEPETDLYTFAQGNVSLTPLTVDGTDYERLREYTRRK